MPIFVHNTNFSMRIFLLVFCITIFSGTTFAQRYAVADGLWTATSTWATSSGGAPGASVPGAADDVFTDGFHVIVNTPVSCRNLYIRSDVANSLDIGDNSVSINGE